MDLSQHFYCDAYSAHLWEHGSPLVRTIRRAKHPLENARVEKDGSVTTVGPSSKFPTYNKVTTYGWREHMMTQYANTSRGRIQMNMASESLDRVPDLFGKKWLHPIDPVSWIIDGDVFIMDIYMSYSHTVNTKSDIFRNKHVRLYIDRGLCSKVLGWENWDDTITKMSIDKCGNVALTVLEDKKRKRNTWESDDESSLGDDSDFSEDEDGYAIPKRNRKVIDRYRVKKTTILTPQEFATAVFNEHDDLHFFVDAVRKVLLRPRRIGLLTLCKMLIKVRRLHYQAIGRKWAPGGSEYTKHLKCDTAQVMSAPCTQFEVVCM